MQIVHSEDLERALREREPGMDLVVPAFDLRQDEVTDDDWRPAWAEWVGPFIKRGGGL